MKKFSVSMVSVYLLGLIICLVGCANVDRYSNGIPNLALVEPGIWRGGQPNEQGWNYLKSIGIKRSIKLNTEEEANDFGAMENNISVIYLPISAKQQIFSKPDPQLICVAVFSIQTDGTFVHCQHGQDRTGLVIGAYRVLVMGWTKKQAWAEMNDYGFHWMLFGLYRSWTEDIPSE